MNARHGEEGEVLYGDPFTFQFSIHWLTMIDMEGEFEVRESLSEGSDGLLDLDTHARLFFNITS